MPKTINHMSADEVISHLQLEPHPEGGFFRETFRDIGSAGTEGIGTGSGRAFSTAIYYLLRDGEVSHWHRVDSGEVWHWYAGGRINLSISLHGNDAPTHFSLGPDIAMGEAPQIVVPANAWQSASCVGPWCLVGCTVAPGFEFDAFELAPAGWRPGLK